MVNTAWDEKGSIGRLDRGTMVRTRKEALPGGSASSTEQAQFGVTR